MAGLRLATLGLYFIEIAVVDAILGKSLPGAGQSFSAPSMAAQQFLMISSPSEKKVVWTDLENMESRTGRAFALVDSGLDSPRGLAFDHNRGFLYVADTGAKKIFRYTVLVDVSGTQPTLTTTGVRLTITQGRAVEWLTVDEKGNLFYTAPDTNNINKISSDVMRRIAKGEFAASSLQIVSQKTLEAEQSAKRALEKKAASDPNRSSLPVDEPPVLPHISSIYEAKLNSHVSSPASIWAEGPNLYWTNQRDGTKAGTVVKGQVNPTVDLSKKGPVPSPATSLTSQNEGAFGLAKSEKAMFFTRNGTVEGSGTVTGLLLGTNIAIDFVTSLQKPRGLVWDKDETMYVADEADGHVFSFPVGRMMRNVPLTKAVSMKGAYGLVLLSANDKGFTKNKVWSGGELSDDEVIAQKMSLLKASGPEPSPAAAGFLETGASRSRESLAKRGQGLEVIIVMIASMISLLVFSQ